MFLLVPAYPGCPGSKAVKRSLLLLLFFYESEIQKVVKSDEDYFDVETILKTRKRGGRIEYLVKWVGYPAKFNSWTDILQPKKSIKSEVTVV